MSKWLFSIINVICLIVIALLSAVEIPTFNYAFYNYEYDKNQTYDTIGISKYDLRLVSDKLMGYMKGSEDDLVIFAYINGENREFFNDLEKAHMVDVKNLFQISYEVRNIAVIILIITYLIAFIYKKRPALREYAKMTIGGFISFIVIIAVIAMIIMSNFSHYFTIFHEIFFTNDMWILNPATDLLINIVPLPFFIDIFICVVSIFLLFSLIIILISYAYLKKIADN